MTQNPLLTKLVAQWESLPVRDRTALKWLSVALGIFILYFAVWEPARKFMQQSEASLIRSQELLQFVKQNQEQARQIALKSRAGGSLPNSQKLVSTVSGKARQYKLTLKRFEPSGDDKVKVWMENVSFDSMMSWITDLQKNAGIHVSQISVDQEKTSGLVNARLTLKAG